MAELSSYDKDHIACKAENIYYLALQKKNLSTPDLEAWTNSMTSLSFQTYSFLLPIV